MVVDGEVVEVNQAVIDNPALVNDDPFGEAWIIKVKPADPSQVESLKAAADYDADHGCAAGAIGGRAGRR